MSLIKNIADIDKSQENLLFKIFESRSPSLFFPEMTNDGDVGSGCFTDRGPSDNPRSRVKPTELLESSNPDMFQMKTSAIKPVGVYSGDPNLPKRLHVSNIPFRYR